MVDLTRRQILGAGATAALVTGLATPSISAHAGPTVSGAGHFVSTPQELAAALLAAVAGDTITMANGVWPNTTLVIGDGYHHGTAEAPIRLQAEVPGQVILSGNSFLKLGRDHWHIDGLTFKDGYNHHGEPVILFAAAGAPWTAPEQPGHHCVISNVSIVDFSPPVSSEVYQYVYFHGTNHRITRCHFSGKTNLGAYIAGGKITAIGVPTRHRIDHNYLGEQPILSNGAEAIAPLYTTLPDEFDENIIEHNLIHHCHGEYELISLKSSGNIVRHNTLIEDFNKPSRVGVISMRTGGDNLIEGNYLFGVGIRVTGPRQKIINNYIDSRPLAVNASDPNLMPESVRYPQVDELEVVNNTFVRTDTTQWASAAAIMIGVKAGGGTPVPSKKLSFINNLVEWGGTACVIPTMLPEELRWQDNIMYGAPIGVDDNPGEIDILDPELEVQVRNNTDILAPGQTSPARRWGAPHPLISQDIEGNRRPLGRCIAVGSHECAWRSLVRLPPLTPADVGPPYDPRG